MFTPFDPNAGPIGGEGFAAPPFTCNLINPLTSFAIFYCIKKIKFIISLSIM
jgi:hypothetical protein